MKIVCVSDTHSKHRQIIIPDGDILIHAGDLTPRGNYYEFCGISNWFGELLERFKHIIFIAGNHDWAFEINKRKMLLDFFSDSRIIYLQDTSAEIEGVKFYGSPWTQQFYNWAFMREDDELAKYWAAIPDDVNVLITHGPPFGILDKESDNARCGSRTLYDRIKQLKHLKHHIFGHIHESYGQEKIDDVTFHNASSLNGQYQYQNPPIVIEYEKVESTFDRQMKDPEFKKKYDAYVASLPEDERC